MGRIREYLVCLSLINLSLVSPETFNVLIETERHVNVVDGKFLSFTIDPKYLFRNSDNFNSQECLCMALALTPAYIRIAGPSTPDMTFYNTTISIGDLDSSTLDLTTFEGKKSSPDDRRKRRAKKVHMEELLPKDGLVVSHSQWRKFVEWAKSAGFDLVFALNNEERTGSGMWDPNTALNILTVAERANIGEIFWQLGYECHNQSIEEYLNDLETLRVIVETFPPGREGGWRVVAGDVTHCLHADSKSDFKDYLTLSNDMMDAVLLNGNSSSQELERMTEKERMRLLHVLSRSTTPLWLTESADHHGQLERAADWLSSLGYSARNGFAVHFRELQHDELHQPTLSFYMALLFKNLVGERVLDVDMEPEQAILFAHCTSLRHKPVPGAVTLYGANMDDEPARFSIKLSKREEGGDIMQFILAFDHSGNIVVNGRAMYYEGDIKPVVKRVRPYKALLINLPPKSFGFWVLANTDVQACSDVENDGGNTPLVEAELLSDTAKVRRSINADFDDYLDENVSTDFVDNETTETNNSAMNNRITNLNNDLNKFRVLVATQSKKDERTTRQKRQTEDDTINSNVNRKLKRFGLKNRIDKNKLLKSLSKPKRIIGNFLKSKRNSIITTGHGRRHSRLNRNKVNKYSKYIKAKKTNNNDCATPVNQAETNIRTRRSLNKINGKETEQSLKENEIVIDDKDSKLWKILKRINKQINELSSERDDLEQDYDDERFSENDKIDSQTDDLEFIDNGDEEDTGFIKETIENLLSVLVELNKNINRFWNALTLLE